MARKTSNKTSGIYVIENTINNKKYVGQSVNLKERLTSHKRQLRKNAHFNCILQSAWNKYGEEKFLFYPIEMCHPDNLDEKEKYYINFLKSMIDENGYNLYTGGSLTRNPSFETRNKMSKAKENYIPWNKGKKASPEAIRNQSLSHLGKPSGRKGYKCSDEEKKKMSETSKKYWSEHESPSIGRRMSLESRKKMSQSKMGKSPSNKGVPMMDVTKDKLSKIKTNKQVKRKKNPSNTSKYLGVYFVKAKQSWRATIQLDKNALYLGSFDNETSAAKIRDIHSYYYFGENAVLNFPSLLPEYIKQIENNEVTIKYHKLKSR